MAGCEGPFLGCTMPPILVPVGTATTSVLSQNVSNRLAFNVGATEVVVSSRTRTFSISSGANVTVNADFATLNGEGGIIVCSSGTTASYLNTLSESYTCVTTTLYFLDTRYDNAIGSELTETMQFGDSNSAMATFRTPGGDILLPKFHMDDVKVVRTTEFFVIVKGIKTVLDTVTTTLIVHSVNDPLIIVYPNPPSIAIPTYGCEDILQYGFYDYYAVGEEENQVKIRRDGGDDFYYTDWMRTMGTATGAAEQAKADERYFSHYLGEHSPVRKDLFNPGVIVDNTPVGSITVDPAGNVFYSVFLNGKYFSAIDGGIIPELFPEVVTNPRFYPIGIL
jgi:hypothetical protein